MHQGNINFKRIKKYKGNKEGRMDEWMNGWMDGRKEGCKEGSLNASFVTFRDHQTTAVNNKRHHLK